LSESEAQGASREAERHAFREVEPRDVASLGAERGAHSSFPVPPVGPPFQTLSYEELLAKLRALTNLRVVADAGSAKATKSSLARFPAGRGSRSGKALYLAAKDSRALAQRSGSRAGTSPARVSTFKPHLVESARGQESLEVEVQLLP